MAFEILDDLRRSGTNMWRENIEQKKVGIILIWKLQDRLTEADPRIPPPNIRSIFPTLTLLLISGLATWLIWPQSKLKSLAWCLVQH